MRVKKVSPKDLTELNELEQMVFAKDSFPKILLRKLIKRNLFFLKLEKNIDEKEIIGFVIVISDDVEHTSIINLLVKPSYQNKGFGSYLLKRVLDKIIKIGNVKTISLNVKVVNAIAIKLYQRFRFEIVEKIKNYYPLGEDSYLMELKLK